MAVSGKLKPFIREFSLKCEYDVCYGVYENYLVTFSHYDKSIELFIDSRLGTLDRASYERLRGIIQSNANGYGVKSFQLTATGLSVVVGDKEADTLLDFFYMLVNELRYLKVPGCEVCTNCGRAIDGESAVIKLGRHVHTCDRQCADRIERGSADVKKPSSNGRPVLGFVGALILCVLSCAVYLFFGYKGWFCSWAVMLMPIFAFLGFRLFGGRPSLGAGISCVVAPLLVFPLASFSLLTYMSGEQWLSGGYSFSVRELIECVKNYILNSFSLSDPFVVRQLGMGLVFLALGLLFVLPSCRGRKRSPRFARLES